MTAARRASANAACSEEQDDNGTAGADCCVTPVEIVTRCDCPGADLRMRSGRVAGG
jgi:hypothetical protein